MELSRADGDRCGEGGFGGDGEVVEEALEGVAGEEVVGGDSAHGGGVEQVGHRVLDPGQEGKVWREAQGGGGPEVIRYDDEVRLEAVDGVKDGGAGVQGVSIGFHEEFGVVPDGTEGFDEIVPGVTEKRGVEAGGNQDPGAALTGGGAGEAVGPLGRGGVVVVVVGGVAKGVGGGEAFFAGALEDLGDGGHDAGSRADA